MDSSAKRYLQYFSAPVLCGIYVLLSFCLPQIAGLIMGCIALFFLLKHGLILRNLRLHIVDIAILLLLLGEFVLTIFQTQGLYPKTYLFSLACNMLVYFTLRFFLQKEKQARLFNSILAGFVILLALITMLSFIFFKFNIEYEGFTDLVNFKAMFQPLGVLLNDWSTILLLSAAFLLTALAKARYKSVWFWILLAGCGLLTMSLLVSFSRGIYLSLFVGLLMFIIISIAYRTIRLKKLLLIVACSIGLTFLVSLPVSDGVKTTTGFSVTTSQVRSTSSRIRIFQTAFQLFKEQPVTGVGHGKFSMYANPILAQKEDSFYTSKATNSYLQLLVEKGIVGFILWGAFISVLLLLCLRLIKMKKKNGFVLSIVFSVLVAAMFRELTFSTFFSKPQMQLLFFVLAAWLVNQDKKFIHYSKWNKLLPLTVFLIFIVLSGFEIAYKISEKANNKFINKYQEQDYPGALTAINRALKTDTKNPILLANKGLLLYQMQQYDSLETMVVSENALTYYRKAVDHSPKDPYLHHNLAYLYSVEGNIDSADYHFSSAIKLSENTALFHAGRGIFLDKNGKSKEAWKEYQKAIRYSPEIVDSELGQKLKTESNYRYNKMINEIADSLTNKIDINNSPILKGRLAKVLLHKGDTLQATKLLEQVSSQLPNLDRVWYQLGIIKLTQNDTTEFLNYLNRAMLLDGRDYLYYLQFGDYYFKKGKKDDAKYHYKQTLQHFSYCYTNHSIVAPKWYGYHIVVNDIIPSNRIKYLQTNIDKNALCNKLLKIYDNENNENERDIIMDFKKGKISLEGFLKELTDKTTLNRTY
jgi:O-antigen ligase/tetratricopeptide (TPR) repeat protein